MPHATCRVHWRFYGGGADPPVRLGSVIRDLAPAGVVVYKRRPVQLTAVKGQGKVNIKAAKGQGTVKGRQ